MVILRVKTLQKQPLVISHSTPIIPLGLGIELHAGRLACPLGVSMLNRHQITVFHRGRVCHGEGMRLNRAVDGTPDVDDAVATLQKFGRLGAHVEFHTLLGRVGRLIDVCSEHGRAGSGGIGAANGVVEEEDPLRAIDMVQQ